MSKDDKCIDGYVSCIDTPNFAGIKTEDILLDSVSAFRSTIFSTGMEYAIGKNVPNYMALRFSGGFLIDSIFTSIVVMLDEKEEGKLKASITGFTASGVATAVGVCIIGRVLAGLSVPALPAFIISTVLTGIVSGLANEGADYAWDKGTQWVASYKYDESNGNIEVNTPLQNPEDINNLVAPLVEFKDEKGMPAIGKIEVKQTASDGTSLLKLGVEECVYNVATGDTMYKISKKLGVSEADLLKTNPWLNDRYSEDKSFALIRPNETLKYLSGKGNKTVEVSELLNEVSESSSSNEKPAVQEKTSGEAAGGDVPVKSEGSKESSGEEKDDEDGHWITKNGNHILIEDSADFNYSFGFDPKGMAYSMGLVGKPDSQPLQQSQPQEQPRTCRDEFDSIVATDELGRPIIYFGTVSPEVLAIRNDPEMRRYLGLDKK